jgi:hypothetical protein
MTYSFHPDAEHELNASIDYFQECKEGLGLEFAHAVQNTEKIKKVTGYFWPKKP